MPQGPLVLKVCSKSIWFGYHNFFQKTLPIFSIDWFYTILFDLQRIQTFLVKTFTQRVEWE